jgi:hypothetical protein
MKSLVYFALSSAVAAALLAGCAGSQPTMVGLRAMPQTHALTAGDEIYTNGFWWASH